MCLYAEKQGKQSHSAELVFQYGDKSAVYWIAKNFLCPFHALSETPAGSIFFSRIALVSTCVVCRGCTYGGPFAQRKSRAFYSVAMGSVSFRHAIREFPSLIRAPSLRPRFRRMVARLNQMRGTCRFPGHSVAKRHLSFDGTVRRRPPFVLAKRGGFVKYRVDKVSRSPPLVLFYSVLYNQSFTNFCRLVSCEE